MNSAIGNADGSNTVYGKSRRRQRAASLPNLRSPLGTETCPASLTRNPYSPALGSLRCAPFLAKYHNARGIPTQDDLIAHGIDILPRRAIGLDPPPRCQRELVTD